VTEAIRKDIRKCYVRLGPRELDTFSRITIGTIECRTHQELSLLLGFDKTLSSTVMRLCVDAGFLFFEGKNYSKELSRQWITDWSGGSPCRRFPSKRGSQNKARVIAEIDPDILLLQKIEDRASLKNSPGVPPWMGCSPFDEIFVVQGTINMGLEMAIMSQERI